MRQKSPQLCRFQGLSHKFHADLTGDIDHGLGSVAGDDQGRDHPAEMRTGFGNGDTAQVTAVQMLVGDDDVGNQAVSPSASNAPAEEDAVLTVHCQRSSNAVIASRTSMSFSISSTLVPKRP